MRVMRILFGSCEELCVKEVSHGVDAKVINNSFPLKSAWVTQISYCIEKVMGSTIYCGEAGN